MNPFIFKKLGPAYQALHAASKKGKLPSELHRYLRDKIENEANRITRGKQDRLARKLRENGNKGGYMWQKIQQMYPELYADKGVGGENVGQWLSVEIECVFPNKAAELSFLTFIRKNKLERYLTVKNDGSIRTYVQCVCPQPLMDARTGRQLRECTCAAREAFGREIIVSFIYGHWDFIKLVCGKLNSLDVFVNNSCGLHVHFDCRHLDARKVTAIGKRVARCVPALKQILPKSRENNAFCQTEINQHRVVRSEGREGRYAFVNLQAYSKHKTLEIRGHSGTTDAKKIVNWIRILRKLMDTRNAVRISTATELINKFRFDSDLVDYISERQKKFSGAPGRHPLAADDVVEDNLGASKDFAVDVGGIRSVLGIDRRIEEERRRQEERARTREETRRALERVANRSAQQVYEDTYSYRIVAESDMHSPPRVEVSVAPAPTPAVAESEARTIVVDTETTPIPETLRSWAATLWDNPAWLYDTMRAGNIAEQDRPASVPEGDLGEDDTGDNSAA